MELQLGRRELRGDEGGASFYASSSSAARYAPDAGLNQHGIAPAGTSLRDPLLALSRHEDRELEIRRYHLREIADRIELAHYRMLEAHDRRALAIAERDPYARPIPFYPELPADNTQVNRTAQAIPHSSLQRVAPTYPELLDVRHNVQKDLNLGPHWGPRDGVEVPSILRNGEEVVPSVGPSYLPEPRDGARSHCQPIESVERLPHDPFLQSQFTGYNMMLPPRFMHEPPAPLAVPAPVPVPINQKKARSSADSDKKHKKKYGDDVIQVKPTVQWSKWPCVWCSVNFDSKEAMDSHLQEKHQGCKVDSPIKSEKVENNVSTEGITGLTVESDGYHKEISESSGLHANKMYQLALSPGNSELKTNKLRKGEVMVTPGNKEAAGYSSDKKIQPDVTQIPNEVLQTSENKEIAGSSINRKRKPDSPPINLKHKRDKPSRDEIMPLPEKKVKPATDTTEPAWVGPEGGWFCDLCKINTLTKRTLDYHFQSNAHLEKLNALLNGSKKSEPANKNVTEKPVQGVPQSVSLQKLEPPKEETSKSIPVPQSDKPKEVTSHEQGNPSSSNKAVIVTGHKMTKQPTPKFSKNKNNAPDNSTAKLVPVKQHFKWFCNLCDAKFTSEKNKEDHIKGKRHRENLQAQAKRPKPSVPLHHCVICNVTCVHKRALIDHFNGKKHRNNIIAMTKP